MGDSQGQSAPLFPSKWRRDNKSGEGNAGNGSEVGYLVGNGVSSF